MVTGLRAFAGAVPKGECELHLTRVAGSKARDSGDGDDVVFRIERTTLDDVRNVSMRARDIATAAGRRLDCVVVGSRVVGSWRTVRTIVREA